MKMFNQETAQAAVLTRFSQLPIDQQNALSSEINRILLANRDRLSEVTEATALQFHYAKIQKTGGKVD